MKFEEKIPLNKLTSLKVGGPADLFCRPTSRAELLEALAFARHKGLKILFLGKGSNLLIPDDGFRGLVISLGEGFDSVEIKGSRVVAGAGVSGAALLTKLAAAGLSGLEFMAGVPCSLGGGVTMNLGAYGSDISHFVRSVKVISLDGIEKTLSKSDLDYRYRHSLLQNGEFIAVEIELELIESQPSEVQALIDQYLADRRSKHPLELPNAGSIFRNPKPLTAWRLIEEAGLKGHQIGGAKVSDKHANFIVNVGGATAADVQKLIVLIQEKVKARSGILLEPEIKIVIN